MSEQASLIEYPCPFPLKIMGHAHPELTTVVVSIVHRYDPSFDAKTIEVRASSGGKYTGLTCTVLATSRPQLDALYTELTSHPLVKVVL
jgi:uncharacterized protein